MSAIDEVIELEMDSEHKEERELAKTAKKELSRLRKDAANWQAFARKSDSYLDAFQKDMKKLNGILESNYGRR